MKNTETALAKKKFQLPDTYVIVALVVLLMVALSWIVPPGAYDYEKIDVNGTMRNVAIDGTFIAARLKLPLPSIIASSASLLRS